MRIHKLITNLIVKQMLLFHYHTKCIGNRKVYREPSNVIVSNGGIPLSTKSAPLLFALLVNRLVSSWPNRLKYVDDTTVFEIIPRCSPSYLQFIVNEIRDFASVRGMRLNPKKCVTCTNDQQMSANKASMKIDSRVRYMARNKNATTSSYPF